eukprot:1939001-Pyramimonas_sp.AAC.1
MWKRGKCMLSAAGIYDIRRCSVIRAIEQQEDVGVIFKWGRVPKIGVPEQPRPAGAFDHFGTTRFESSDTVVSNLIFVFETPTICVRMEIGRIFSYSEPYNTME